jgi:hypothetical protein
MIKKLLKEALIKLYENADQPQYSTKQRQKDIFDLMGDKTGEITVTDFNLGFPDGAIATGRLENDTAVITRIRAPRNPNEYGPLRGTRTYDRVIEFLKQQGATKLKIPNQSLDSRAALKKMVDKGILSNPRLMTGISVDQHPALFDIT